MADIVKRLEKWADEFEGEEGDLMREGAAEIELLRAQMAAVERVVAITKANTLGVLRNEQSNADFEMAHIHADVALCGLLRALGHADVVDEWEKVNKQYA